MSSHTPESSLRRFVNAISEVSPAGAAEQQTASLITQQHEDRIQIGDMVFTPMGYTSLEELGAS